MYLKEAYDIEYGLYNHDDPNLNHPFQYSLWTEKKSIKQFSLMRYYLKMYNYRRILKYFGLTFLDFINLPIDKVDDILHVAEEFNNLEHAQAENTEREIRGQLNQAERNAQQVDQTGQQSTSYYGY